MAKYGVEFKRPGTQWVSHPDHDNLTFKGARKTLIRLIEQAAVREPKELRAVELREGLAADLLAGVAVVETWLGYSNEDPTLTELNIKGYSFRLVKTVTEKDKCTRLLENAAGHFRWKASEYDRLQATLTPTRMYGAKQAAQAWREAALFLEQEMAGE